MLLTPVFICFIPTLLISFYNKESEKPCPKSMMGFFTLEVIWLKMDCTNHATRRCNLDPIINQIAWVTVCFVCFVIWDISIWLGTISLWLFSYYISNHKHVCVCLMAFLFYQNLVYYPQHILGKNILILTVHTHLKYEQVQPIKLKQVYWMFYSVKCICFDINWLSTNIIDLVLMSWPSRETYFHLLKYWLFSVHFSCHF